MLPSAWPETDHVLGSFLSDAYSVQAGWSRPQVTEVLTGVPAGKPGGHGPGSQPGSLTCADQLACHVAMKRRPGLG